LSTRTSELSTDIIALCKTEPPINHVLSKSAPTYSGNVKMSPS